MSKYEWLRDEDDEVCECDSCHMKAPLLLVKHQFFDPRGEVKFKFCKLCASTFAGNATQYPDQYDHGSVMRHQCALQNLLIDELTGRSPPEKETT